MGRFWVWVGAYEEFKEFSDRTKNLFDGMEGVDLKGVFVPVSEWNFVELLKGSFEKILKAYRRYVQKYGSPT